MADEKKIFIDEGWKSQVEREREETRLAGEQADEETVEQGEEEAPDGPQMDPTSMTGLVTSLATQALFALGIIAPRDAQEVSVDIAGAKMMIDTLLMLREKTEGNLSEEEAGHMTETLGELQRFYVARAQQMQEAALKEAGIDMDNLKAPGV